MITLNIRHHLVGKNNKSRAYSFNKLIISESEEIWSKDA